MSEFEFTDSDLSIGSSNNSNNGSNNYLINGSNYPSYDSLDPVGLKFVSNKSKYYDDAKG